MRYISIISLVTAIASAIVAGLLYWMTRQNFELANRPYLILQNYGVIKDLGNGNTYIEPIPHRMMYKCYRTPVEVLDGEVWISVFKADNSKDRICTVQIEPQIILPLGRSEGEATINFGKSQWDKILQKFSELKENEEIRLEARFNYRWAGNNKFNREYSYYGMSKLAKGGVIFERKEIKFYNWELIKQKIT